MNSQCTRCSGAHKLADCPWPLLPESEDMPKPHKHAELIKAWADGAEIELFNGTRWTDISVPIWSEAFKYRIKPEPPVKVYPATLLTARDFNIIVNEVTSGVDFECFAIANAAIRHAIDHDQVVPMSEVQEVARNLAKKDRDARDMAVAQAVYLTLFYGRTPAAIGGPGTVNRAPDFKFIIDSIEK